MYWFCFPLYLFDYVRFKWVLIIPLVTEIVLNCSDTFRKSFYQQKTVIKFETSYNLRHINCISFDF